MLRTFYRDPLERVWQGWKKIKIRREESLPSILTEEEVGKTLAAVEESRFRTIVILMYLHEAVGTNGLGVVSPLDGMDAGVDASGRGPSETHECVTPTDEKDRYSLGAHCGLQIHRTDTDCKSVLRSWSV